MNILDLKIYMDTHEEHISVQNEEQSVLHNLLLNFSSLLESNGFDSNGISFNDLVKSIFEEFVSINPEPINPTREYTLRWSDLVKTSDGNEEVVHYEISYEPIQYQDILKKSEKKNIRDATRHLESYRKIKDDDPILSQTCSICYDNYLPGQFKRELSKCNHTFHKKCIDKWFVSHPTLSCPMCRTNYNKQDNIISTNLNT